MPSLPAAQLSIGTNAAVALNNPTWTDYYIITDFQICSPSLKITRPSKGTSTKARYHIFSIMPVPLLMLFCVGVHFVSKPTVPELYM